MLACRSPVIASKEPTSPTTAAILLNPPASGGVVTSYEVKLCPSAPSTGPCLTKSCPTASCSVTGLTPDTTYRVSAAAVVGGIRVPASNTLPLTMPAADSPTLTSAVDTSARTATTTAAAPPGATYTQVGVAAGRELYSVVWVPAREPKRGCGGVCAGVTVPDQARHVSCHVFPPKLQYIFTATPLGGGSPAITTSSNPQAVLTGLAPATQVGIESVAGAPPTLLAVLPAGLSLH